MKIKRSADLIMDRKYPTLIKQMQAQTNVHWDIYINVHIDDHVHTNGMVYECLYKWLS